MKHVKTKNRVVREVSDKHTMNIRVLFSLVFLIVITFTVSAQTAVWQWAVPVRNFAKQPKNPDAKAYLWIPEKCKHVKAVLVAQHNIDIFTFPIRRNDYFPTIGTYMVVLHRYYGRIILTPAFP